MPVQKYGKGRFRIRFYDQGQVRRSLTLGKVTKKAAQSADRHVAELVVAAIGGTSIPAATAKWVSAQHGKTFDKLVEWQLVEPREDEPEPETMPTLVEWYEHYIDVMKASAGTKRNWRTAKNKAAEFFGTKKLDEIKTADAIEWFNSMRQNLAENTARKTVSIARQVVSHAVDAEKIDRNPFVSKKLPTTVEAKDKPYIDVALMPRMLRAVPTTEWKCVLVMARIAGMRVQSEAPLLQWGHVDWDANSIAVYSPKTKKTRTVPLFPELREVLEELYDVAPDGSEFILETIRHKSSNWRQPLAKWLTKAGIEPWPSLFNAMRASAEIDLAKRENISLVCEWIGNTPEVALKHYTKATDDDYLRVQKYVPRYVPTTSADDSNASQTEDNVIAETYVSPAYQAHSESDSLELIPSVGFEPT